VIGPDPQSVVTIPDASALPSAPERSEAELLAELAPALLSTLNVDGVVMFANGAWERLLGWDPAEVVGSTLSEFLHEQEHEELAAKFAVARAQPGTELFFLGRTATKDGPWLWIDWRIRFGDDRWTCAGQLAPESGRARSERLASENQLSDAQRVAGVGSFQIDIGTQELRWSDEVFRIFGVEPGEVQLSADFVVALAHPDDRQRLAAYWEQLLLDPESGRRPTVEFRIQRADGAERIISARGSLVEEGDERRIVGIAQDVTEQRRAQQALEASERRYRALVEQVPAAVFTAAAGPEGEWEFVSPHIERMLGYPVHEWTANSAQWFSVVHPEDRERVIAMETELSEPGDHLSMEYRMVASDGRIVHVHDEATMIENERGQLKLQGVLLDVTERREAEAALAESEERYRRIVETSQDLIWQLDAENRFTFVNDAVRHMHGYEPEEMIGRPFTDFQTPEVAARDLAAGQEARVGEPINGYETQHLRKDGTAIDLSFNAVALRDADGNVLSITGTARDITAAKRHEAELQTQHAQLQAIIDNSPMVIFAKDRDLRYLFVNREHEELFDLEPGEVIGKRVDSFMPPETSKEVQANDRRVLEGGEPMEVEEVIPRPGGDRVYMVHKFPLRDAEGEIRGLCGIAIDITERKAREETLSAKVEWSFRIRQAISQDRFVLHAQPIVEIASGEKVQEELLLRMIPDSGDDLIMPNEFLPPAERFGLAPAIDRWVVARAAQLACHQRVEVNLSAQSLGDSALTGYIEAQLAASGADPANLVFEITETAAASDLLQAGKLANRLVSLGCGFALDDFGTGYGSFTYLKHLPVGFIKIDMSFVRNLVTDASDRQVVKAIVDVARTFEIKTIAEGVEDKDTMDQLVELDVDFAQGYYLGRPVPIAER
jgi:PAS domain S-box-containing protein